jgi:hypothetical protein
MALGVLHKFSGDYRQPTAIEAYDRVAYFRPEDLPPLPYTREALIEVLERVRYSRTQ